MTGRYVAEHPLDRRLRLLGKEALAEQRLGVIWSYYEESTGGRLQRPPTNDERGQVIQWLRAARLDGEWATLFAKWPVLQGAAFQTMTEKAGSVRQYTCLACELIVREDGTLPMSLGFALDVEPWTAQSAADRVRIRETVTREMKQRKIYRPTHLDVCMSIVSLVPRSARGFKDVDNLVKGLLDSFEGVLYYNDRQVQCLTSRRMEYAGPTGAYFVFANAVRPWDADVILDDGNPPVIV